jgi:hypothetical protein
MSAIIFIILLALPFPGFVRFILRLAGLLVLCLVIAIVVQAAATCESLNDEIAKNGAAKTTEYLESVVTDAVPKSLPHRLAHRNHLARAVIYVCESEPHENLGALIIRATQRELQRCREEEM